MYDRKKIRSAQNVTDVSFFVVYIGDPSVLEGYSDANWISDADEMKTTTGVMPG